ncbi:phage tail assembly chaperone [Apilactobacillus xinyiensis]|uniref:phage tail assembly chaperone n=1 Tax=Apilactobacillus xinyiensis TaxID=2841032 RepID=UPI00200F6B7D|nr:hypothetical protein [Apilactobacillus xinyiensis]MCL0330614.1 hypothetical protein [Apilactobacillus xinyiensis]
MTEEQVQEQETTEAISLNDFLVDNVDTKIEKQNVQFKRFKSPFVVRPLTANELSDLRKKSTIKHRDPRTKMVSTEIDSDKLSDLMIVKSVVTPDLNNQELQNSWGYPADPTGLLKGMLLSGEYNHLAAVITDLSGDNEDDVDVDDVKK